MTELGNELVNGILEAKSDANTKKAKAQSSRYCKLMVADLIPRDIWDESTAIHSRNFSCEVFEGCSHVLKKKSVSDLGKSTAIVIIVC